MPRHYFSYSHTTISHLLKCDEIFLFTNHNVIQTVKIIVSYVMASRYSKMEKIPLVNISDGDISFTFTP